MGINNLKVFNEQQATLKNIWTLEKDSVAFYTEAIRHEKILKNIHDKSRTILDLGCGDGYLSNSLAASGHHVTSGDISEERLRKMLSIPNESRIHAVLCDFAKSPLADQSFDIVVASEVIEHIPDFSAVMREVNRVLKQSGILLVSVPYKEKIEQVMCPHCLQHFNPIGHLHSFDESKLRGILVAFGFEVQKVQLINNLATRRLKRLFDIPYRLFSLLDSLMVRFFPNYSYYLFMVAKKKSNINGAAKTR